MSKIRVAEVGDLLPGTKITDVDSDEYGYGTFVPSEVYDPKDQCWAEVVSVAGYVDRPTVLLRSTGGTETKVTAPVNTPVWVLEP